MQSPNDNTLKQLELIREAGEALDEAAIEWWLFGGWAMDFHAGTITRDHADVEIFVRDLDAGQARSALAARGFAAPASLHPDEGQPFLKDGQEIGLTYLFDAGDLGSRGPGRWSGWSWPSGWFDGPLVTLRGVSARPLSLAGLLAMKAEFAAQTPGAPLREKDRADIEMIRTLIARQA